MLKLKSLRTQLILCLVCFALFLAFKDKDFTFLFKTSIAIISALATELIFSYFKTKKLQISESAIITGLIIGFVLSSSELWLKFIFAAIIAIGVKYLIRFKNRHIFNPAALGIFLTLILFGASTAWKGTYFWYIIGPIGIYFAYRFKKIEVLLGYAIVSLLLFGSQAILQRVSFLNIFGYFSYFYIFIMVVEPKTTPISGIGKYLFGAGTAGLIFFLIQTGARIDVELLSLLIMNIMVIMLNKLPG